MKAVAKKTTSDRTAGILLHVSSLPGRYGIGDLGNEAYHWIDSLARAGQSRWQILPLGPPGAGNSPYQCFSAFAGNPALISPDLLLEDGLLARTELPSTSSLKPDGERVDYAHALSLKNQLLARAWDHFQGGSARQLRQEFERFCVAELTWLEDYALFMALREVNLDRMRCPVSWTAWPKDLVLRRPPALRGAQRELSDAIDRHRFVQFLFHRQLAALRQHARLRQVKLIGDLPIFVSANSADVWANPELFLLDRDRRPRVVAGVPPDAFSRTGQRWGNPLYDWSRMRRDDFGWWKRRLKSTLNQVDIVRIDHFRGFAASWHIPASAPTAVRGRWVPTPGAELFSSLRERLGDLPVIAEDLGLITPDVLALRDQFNFPGMKVLQFAFGGENNPYLPHHFTPNCVVYTGTHDNDTTPGWYSTLKAGERSKVKKYLPRIDEEPAWAMIRLAWSSVARDAIVPLQDVLGLGSEARMNTPGRAEGNWRWRYNPRPADKDCLARLADLTRIYER